MTQADLMLIGNIVGTVFGVFVVLPAADYILYKLGIW